MTDFKKGDYIEMTNPHFEYNRGIRAVVVESMNGWVVFDATHVPHGSKYAVGERGSTTTDKWSLTDGPTVLTEADKKLAKIAEYVDSFYIKSEAEKSYDRGAYDARLVIRDRIRDIIAE